MGPRWPTIGEQFAFSSSCSRSLASPDAAPRGWSLLFRPPIPPLERRSNNATEVSALQRHRPLMRFAITIIVMWRCVLAAGLWSELWAAGLMLYQHTDIAGDMALTWRAVAPLPPSAS